MYWEREKKIKVIFFVWDALYVCFHDGFADGDFNRASLIYLFFNQIIEAG